MDKWDKLLQEFIGKDKVESISINYSKKKGVWIYKFREVIDGQKYISTLDFKDRFKAEKFHFHFGGKNPHSVSAPPPFNKIGEWRSGDIMELGHRVTEISLEGNRMVRDTYLDIPLPPDSGHDWLISKNKKKAGNILKFNLSDVEKCSSTRVFTTHLEFDTFIDFLTTDKSLKELTFHVRWFTLENEETNDTGYWKRCMAKDGTNRMILELKSINDITYDQIMFQAILGYADGMADGECCKIGRGKKVQKEDTVCYFAAKNHQAK